MSSAIILMALPHFFMEDYVPEGSQGNVTLEFESGLGPEKMWFTYLVLMTFIASVFFLPIFSIGER